MPEGANVLSLSGTQVRDDYLATDALCPNGSRGRRSRRSCSGRTRVPAMHRPGPDRRLLHDLVAGLTVGASQVGNAMAYTMLAGVPPVHGLYAVAAGTPAGALAGSSQRMPIVPTAALCLAAGGALTTLPPEQRTAGLFTLAVLTGVLMFVLGLLKAGALVRFISNAVMIGLMAGIGVTILLWPLGALTGFSSRYDDKLLKAADLFMHPGATDVETTAIGLATVLLVVVLRRIAPQAVRYGPRVAGMTVAVALLPVESVAVVGDIAPIPRALPWPQVPDFSLIPSLLLPARVAGHHRPRPGVGYQPHGPQRRRLPRRHQQGFRRAGRCQRLLGVVQRRGGGRLRAGDGAQHGAGARTRWSSVVTAAFVILVIVAAAPLVQQVPLAVTAGILIVAATSALQPRAALRRLARRPDVRRRHDPHLRAGPAHATGVRGTRGRGDLGAQIHLPVVARRARQAGGPGRARGCRGRQKRPWRSPATPSPFWISTAASSSRPPPRSASPCPPWAAAHCPVVVLRLRGRGTLHSATIAMLRDYATDCAAHGGRMYLAGVGPEMEEQLRRTGVLDILGPDAVVAATDELYGACATAQQRGRTWLAAHADGRTRGPRTVCRVWTRHPAGFSPPASRAAARERALRMLPAPVVQAGRREVTRGTRRVLAALALVVGRPGSPPALRRGPSTSGTPPSQAAATTRDRSHTSVRP